MWHKPTVRRALTAATRFETTQDSGGIGKVRDWVRDLLASPETVFAGRNH
jgi:hypothetical protein